MTVAVPRIGGDGNWRPAPSGAELEEDAVSVPVPRFSFNLADELWIPCEFIDGSRRELSIREVLKQAHGIRALYGELSQMEIALIRMLLAILSRAHFADLHQYPADDARIGYWLDYFQQGHFDEELIDDYCDYVGEGFDLLSPTRPFYQTPGLAYVSKDKDFDPVTSIMADVPGNRSLFTMREPSSVKDLALPEAARWLVFAQAFDVAGIKTPVEGNTHVTKGKVYPPKGLPGTGYCGAIGGVFAAGDTLFETLMRNWVLVNNADKQGLSRNEGDLPPWERDAPPFDMRELEPAGPVSMLTWQPRRIRLVLDERQTRVKGIVLCYGDATSLADRQSVETMTAWRRSENQQKKLGTSHIPAVPTLHLSNRSLWRGLASLLAQSADGSVDLVPGVISWNERLKAELFKNKKAVLTVKAQGLAYGTQSSVYDDGIDDSLSLNVAMLRPDRVAAAHAVETVAKTDDAVRQLAYRIADLERAVGNRKDLKFDDPMLSDIRERAYDELDGLFRERLVHFSEDAEPETYCAAWKRKVLGVLLHMAETHLEQSPHRAFAEAEIKKGKSSQMVSVGMVLSRLRRDLAKALDIPVSDNVELGLGKARYGEEA